MKPLLKTIFLLGFASMVSAASFAAIKLDVSQLTAVPDGNY
jgi:hypothetical protein